MKRRLWIFIATLLPFVFHAVELPSQTQESETGEKKVLWVPLEGTVELGLSPFIQRAVKTAESEDYDALILEVDTFGGRVDAATQIRDALIETKVPTVAWVNKRAISAGALISLAADTIYFSAGSTMGAATPIQLQQGGQAAPVENKFVSYFRAEMGSTAERNGRSRKIAEAMVQATEDIDGLVKKGEVLTLTDVTARETGFSDATKNSRAEVLEALELSSAAVDTFSINWAERIVRILTEPTVSGLLMSVGSLAILMELYSPGWGIPGFIGIGCLGLFFLGKFIVHLAGWEEVLFLLIGLGLVLVELLVFPGSFVFGILGIAVMLGALFLSGVSPEIPLDFSFPSVQDQVQSVATSLAVMVIGFIAFLLFISRNPLRLPLVMAEGFKESKQREEDQVYQAWIGKEGVVHSDLRPSGTVDFGDERIDVSSESGFIASGAKVKIIKAEGNRIFVREIKDEK